jgi:hypothetical protein
VTLFCGSRFEYLVWLEAISCGWDGRWVLYVGMLPQNTVAMTIVCILVALGNDHNFTIFVTCFSFPRHLSCTWSSRVCKVCVVLFNYFFLTNTPTLIILYSGTDFYCVKLILLLQWYLLKGNFLHKYNIGVMTKFRFTECFVTLVFVKNTYTHTQVYNQICGLLV